MSSTVERKRMAASAKTMREGWCMREVACTARRRPVRAEQKPRTSAHTT